MKQYRIDQSKGMEFGLYTLGDHIMNPENREKLTAQERINEIIELGQLAEQAGIDVFSVGESHQTHFTTQAHSVVLGAIAQATDTIKLASSSTVLSVHDPVRAYEQEGVNLPRSTGGQVNAGKKVSYNQAQPGDLVFFLGGSHVGIYLGCGQFIGSQSSTGVAVANMNSGYWSDNFDGTVVRVK